MNNLGKEPARLSAEVQRIEREIVDAAVQKYPVFIHALDTTARVSAELETATSSANTVSQGLRDLRVRSEKLVESGHTWRKERQRVSCAVTQQSKVVELLEGPQTLETCLRHEMFHEALMLLEHFNVIAEAHGDLAIIASLKDEMNLTLQRAVSSVVAKLSTGLPLSLAIKITTFLRRLEVPDKSLRALFIERRDAYIQGLLKDAQSLSNSPYSYLSKLTNIVKVQVADVVVQFQACFVSNSSSNSGGHQNGASENGRDGAADAAVCGIEQAWAMSIVDQFLKKVRHGIGEIASGAELASLSEQVGHCCQSLARVSLDVSPIVMPLITKRIAQVFQHHVQNASTAYETALASHSWSSSRTSSKPSGSEASGNGAANVSSSPPMSLLQYIPLAYALNALLSGFNELRKCAATCIAVTCAASVEKFLRSVVSGLLEISASALFEPKEQVAFALFARATSDDFVPHVCKCFDAAFGQALLAPKIHGIVSPLKPLAAEAPKAKTSSPTPPPESAHAAPGSSTPSALGSKTQSTSSLTGMAAAHAAVHAPAADSTPAAAAAATTSPTTSTTAPSSVRPPLKKKDD